MDNLTLLIAIITATSTILSSLVTITITKIFENYQNSKKHKRIILEKVLEKKLDACKIAITYYGTYLNYLYSTVYTLKNLESAEYFNAQKEIMSFNENLIKKMQLDSNNAHLQILLFYDLNNIEDEKLGENISTTNKNYVDFVSNVQNIDFEEEKKLREDVIVSLENAIKYFKNKIDIVRLDLNNLLKN